MSESFQPQENSNERTSGQELDALYAQFPKELQDHWDEKIGHLPVSEQIDRLKQVLVERKASHRTQESTNLLMPEGIAVYEHFPEEMRSVIEDIRQSDKRIEVGYGQAGHVVAHPTQPGVCYKVMFDDEQLPDGTNHIAEETKLLYHLAEKMDGHYGVRVPRVFAYVHEPDTSAMSMEFLNAASLRKIIERGEEELPEHFDFETFFSALERFVAEMHAMHFYHCDLHWGNVMVDRDTGMPCVIDCGLSTKSAIDEHDACRREYVKGGQKKELVLEYDTVNLAELRRKVRAYVNKRTKLR